MIIDETVRNTKRLIELKDNLSESLDIASIIGYIDGAVIQNNDLISSHEALDLLKKYFINNQKISKDVLDKHVAPLSIIKSSIFMSNPYFKNIKLTEFKDGNISLEIAEYKTNEFAVYNEVLQNNSLENSLKLGIFDSPAYTYVLKENNNVWMSISPSEMNSLQKNLDSATGSVLVLGGGLCYYPYMISLKKNVSEILVVENNPIIYKFIQEQIQPQCNNKIKVVYDDALEYLRKNDLSRFNTIFADIWEDNVSGSEIYKEIVPYEINYPNVKFDYWIEDTILDSYVINIFEYFKAKLGTKEYQEFFKMISPFIWEKMEDIPDRIKRPEQFSYYLNRKFAKKLLQTK